MSAQPFDNVLRERILRSALENRADYHTHIADWPVDDEPFKQTANHVAAVALYNLCRTHEALKMTPAKAIGVVDRAWTIGDLIDAALTTQPITPVSTAPERRKGFTVIDGGKN